MRYKNRYDVKQLFCDWLCGKRTSNEICARLVALGMPITQEARQAWLNSDDGEGNTTAYHSTEVHDLIVDYMCDPSISYERLMSDLFSRGMPLDTDERRVWFESAHTTIPNFHNWELTSMQHIPSQFEYIYRAKRNGACSLVSGECVPLNNHDLVYGNFHNTTIPHEAFVPTTTYTSIQRGTWVRIDSVLKKNNLQRIGIGDEE